LTAIRDSLDGGQFVGFRSMLLNDDGEQVAEEKR
jgi:hypothetical protein